MAHHPNQIDKLLDQLENLVKRQEEISKEIKQIKTQVFHLVNGEVQVDEQKTPQDLPHVEVKEPILSPAEILSQLQPNPPKSFLSDTLKFDWEKFVGENLINKIGIIILVLGVGIGAKYAIDHELISPLTRIIFGYLAGAGLLAVAIRLKRNYEGYSAVLLSGSMAILYFLTFAAYAYYQLIPAPAAYLVMLMFTIFTVVASVQYNRQVIGIIGLVGAYAVPFLLSEDSGRVHLLFTYMAVINFGILTIAVMRYWQYLIGTAFAVTFTIFLYWYSSSDEVSAMMAGGFLLLFFLQFYLAILGNKFISKSQLVIFDYLMLLTNAFLFYGTGYELIQSQPQGYEFLGIFTMGNALLHFLVSLLVYRQKLLDRNLYLITAGFVLLFITIAIPVQLEGNWVTLVWAAQAFVLFWLGRSKDVAHLDKAAYVLIFVALISLVQDWSFEVADPSAQGGKISLTYFLNIRLLTTCIFLAALGGVYVVNRKYPVEKTNWESYLEKVIAVTILLVLYFGIRTEISGYYEEQYYATAIRQIGGDFDFPVYNYNYDILQFKTIALLNFTFVFLVVLSFVNFRKLLNIHLAHVTLSLLILTFLAFLFQGFSALSYLRDAQLFPNQDFSVGWWHIGIRYFSYLVYAIALYTIAKHKSLIKPNFIPGLLLLFHFFILALLTSELINLLTWTGADSFKNVGVSLLWGTYALLLIVLGIWKKHRLLRISGIGLFSVTLLKFFFFDIIGMSTLGKTAIFVGLGVLLLLVSFLYNKYKHKISDEAEN